MVGLFSSLSNPRPSIFLAEIPFVVVVNPSFPTRNLSEFIAYAKTNPGTVLFANSGRGTQAHLTQLMFINALGITANMVPYKGGSPATADLLEGHVDALIDNAAAQIGNVQSGKVRALFVSTKERSASPPTVQTADEAGQTSFITSGWFALAAPKGMPRPAIDKLNNVIVQGLAQPAVKRRLLDAG